MEFIPFELSRLIYIPRLYSIHYFEHPSGYFYPGESHDFWEFVYVDKGRVTVTAEQRELTLFRGQMIFHAPNEFHALSAEEQVAPNLIVVSFQCDSPAMDFFRDCIIQAGSGERALLGRLVEESRKLFSNHLGFPGSHTLLKRPNAPVGGEQMLELTLEELLLRLLRQGADHPLPHQVHDLRQTHVLEDVMGYLEARLDQTLTVQQICRDNMIGRSQLQSLFHQQTGGGVMDCFGRMKIDAARRMIREGKLNFTQIAQRLGFQSVHYFSRRFRHFTGMSPSEYGESVRMLADFTSEGSDNRANK